MRNHKKNTKGEKFMQLICDGLDLSDAVLKVSKAIATKTTNPILEGVRLVAEENELTLSATDLELSIEKKIHADIKEEGEIVVPGKFFSEFVKKLTNEKIELILNDKNQLIIKYIDSEGSISCYNADEYPGFKKIDTSSYFGITKQNLKNLINKSIFSVAVDDSRPILKGCLFEIASDKIASVSSDGYRLSLVNQKIAFSNVETSVIIPDKSLREISKLLDDSDDIVNVYVQTNYIMVDLGDTKVISRLLEGEFLDYKQIVSSSRPETVVTVNKKQLEDALERASLLSKIGQNNLVQFDIRDQNLCITSRSEIGNVRENINIVFGGKELLIAFNARYFMEALRVIPDEFITIKFNQAQNPCVISPFEGDEDKFLYLILPVRLIKA